MLKFTRMSIVIPVYNQEMYILEAIESAINQTYKGEYKIIVVNDGSSDRTLELLNEYKDSLYIINQKNAGTSAAWNNAISICNSDYLIGLDSDDLLEKDTLEKLEKFINSNTEFDIVYSDYYFVDENGEKYKSVKNPEAYNQVEQLVNLKNRLGEENNFLPFGHVRLYKVESLKNAGMYNENYRYAEDYELVLRMSVKGMKFFRIPEFLYKYRWHDTNKGVVSRKEQIEEVIRAVEELV